MFIRVLLSSFLFFIVGAMGWSSVLKRSLGGKNSNNIKQIIKDCSCSIMKKYKSGSTENFYHRALLAELYRRNIPALSEVDVVVMEGAVPVFVGRLDIEVQNTILELKVASCITQKHINQLLKYVRARQSTGMNVQNAGVVCFCSEGDRVDFHFLDDNGVENNSNITRRKSVRNVRSSRFFHGDSKPSK